MNPDLISVDPDPLKAGKAGKVCYDFSGAPEELSSVTLQITWDPSGYVQSVVCTRTEPCQPIAGGVPKTAEGVTIVDQTGPSADYQGTVSPSSP